MDQLFKAFLPDESYTTVAQRREIKTIGDIFNVLQKAHVKPVHETRTAVARSAIAMLRKNCLAKPAVTEQDLREYHAENELDYLKRWSIDALQNLDDEHAANPKEREYRLPLPEYRKKLTQLQGSLGMIAACLTGKELNDHGSPVMLENLMSCMPGCMFLREWLGANPTTFLDELENYMINRMKQEECLDISYDNIRDGNCTLYDHYCSFALCMRVLVITEPLREPFCEKEFDLTSIRGSANQLMGAQGDTLPFCDQKKCAPKIMSACQDARGPDYKVPVQALRQMAAEMNVLIMVEAEFTGLVNSYVFGPGPHRMIFGDITNKKVVMYWFEHNSDNVMGLPGQEVCEEAANYGANDTPENARAAFGVFMMRVKKAGAVVRF